MKKLIPVLTIALLLATASSSWAGGTTFFKARISGTVQTQTILAPTDGRVHTTPLNNTRVFEEFAVSPDDYELVLVLGGSSGLVLEPKLAASALPTLVVIELGNDAVTIIDTKAHAFRLGAVISNSTATNLFQDLAGEVSGTARYKGAFPPTSFSSISLSGFARGTDTSGGGNGSALLRFKISTHGLFVQQ